MTKLIALLVTCAALSACTDPLAPTPAQFFDAVTARGGHSCALTTDGEAYCWGRGADGQLGTGDTQNQFEPTAVQTTERFQAISAGEAHTCALTLDGRALCWGWNGFYQRGNPTDPRNSVPVEVATTLQFDTISAGAHHTCAIALDGAAYCWGNGRYGQNDNGSLNTVITPEAVAGRLRVESISAGAWHTCALANDAAYCWGRNDSGQLGTGSAALTGPEPAVVQGAPRFRHLSAGRSHTCAVGVDDGGYCWGSNEHGELGDGSVFREGLVGSAAPTRIGRLSAFAILAAGSSYTCGVEKATLNAWCWGRNDAGQLGVGDADDHYVPSPVHLQPRRRQAGDLFTVTLLATNGATHAYAVADGSLYCWGSGAEGQLGSQHRLQSFLPQRTR